MAQDAMSQVAAQYAFVKGVHEVRYQVTDVARSVAFYEEHLGFELSRGPRQCRTDSSRSQADEMEVGPAGRAGSLIL